MSDHEDSREKDEAKTIRIEVDPIDAVAFKCGHCSRIVSVADKRLVDANAKADCQLDCPACKGPVLLKQKFPENKIIVPGTVNNRHARRAAGH